jgi:hypothetical protein
MSRPIRFYGDYQHRNARFARQMPRDGIPFASADDADRIIGRICCVGLAVLLIGSVMGVV